ncbi:thioesterase family protein [Microbacterium karelineae]|uniref:thioesterase family protein n=1 Tax=Microbacterium karelineae TaxID=2654283 RepID=UPI0012EA72A6|nr:thioesterase family protein [Microbacterium karelineae]
MNASDSHLASTGELARLIFGDPAEEIAVSPEMWGFGGLHGGLTLSLMTASAAREAPGLALRGITGHFHRAVREKLALSSRVVRAGRSAQSVECAATSPDGLCVTATATFGPPQPIGVEITPPMPAVPTPDSVEPYDDVLGKSPVMDSVEVRPLGDLRPYHGGPTAMMCAWMRVRKLPTPASQRSVLFFLDALPPSYSAVIRERRAVPTLELSAHLSSRPASSPWVLVQATTLAAEDGGWVTEVADAWDECGAHLGRAQQLRLALGAR